MDSVDISKMWRKKKCLKTTLMKENTLCLIDIIFNRMLYIIIFEMMIHFSK